MDQVDIDERDAAVTELAEAIKDDLDAALDGLAWEQNRPRLRVARSGAGAGPADVRHYSFGVARALGEDEWDRAIAIVAAHARRTRFTGASLLADQLQNHEVEFFADDGRSLLFGTAAATILRASIGPAHGDLDIADEVPRW